MAQTYVSRGGRGLVASRLEFERWNKLPYGKWRCADGREVLFSRFYEPLLERRVGDGVREADPKEWVVDIVHQEWFYRDAPPSLGEKKKREVASAALTVWLIPG